MAYINDYKIMDVFNAIDVHTGEMIIPARIFVAPSFDGGEPDFGQAQQRVINTDEISYVYHIPDPRMEWPSVEGYGVHNGSGEVGYIIKGTYTIEYPDGTKAELKPGDYFVNEKGQPYRFIGTSDELGNAYAVFHGTKAQKVGNEPSGDHGTGHANGTTAELNKIENTPDGIEAALIAEVDNLVVYDVVIKPGTVYPFDGWISVNVPAITVVLSGRAAAVYPDQTYLIEELFAILDNPGQPHKLSNIGEEDLHLLVAYKAAAAKDVETKIEQILEFV